MSQTFKEVKSLLGAGSVAELKNILELGQRPTTEPISSEDFHLLKVVYPLVKEGLTVENALQIYNEQSSQKSTDSLYDILRYQFVASGVEDALRNDVKLFYLLYFQCWKDALKSPDILNDPEVASAHKEAINACRQVTEDEYSAPMQKDFLVAFTQSLQRKGFLPVKKEQLLLGAATQVKSNSSINMQVV